MGIIVLVSANNPKGPMRWSDNSIKNNMKPTDWLSVSELESLPAMNSIDFKRLEQMSVQEGADLVNKMCKYFRKHFLIAFIYTCFIIAL